MKTTTYLILLALIGFNTECLAQTPDGDIDGTEPEIQLQIDNDIAAMTKDDPFFEGLGMPLDQDIRNATADITIKEQLEWLLDEIKGTGNGPQLQEMAPVSYRSTDLQKKIEAIIKLVIPRSAPRPTEQLARYALNRGQNAVKLINSMIPGAADGKPVGIVESKNDILTYALQWAVKFYVSPLEQYIKMRKGLAGRYERPLAEFGLKFADGMCAQIDQIPNEKAKYGLMLDTMKRLKADLYYDINQSQYRRELKELYIQLSTFDPVEKIEDGAVELGLANLRQLLWKVGTTLRTKIKDENGVPIGGNLGACVLNFGTDFDKTTKQSVNPRNN